MENFLQMAAYALAWHEEHGIWVDDLAVINVDKENGEPAIITYASDFDLSVEEAASMFISMKYVSDGLRQLDHRWSTSKL